MGDPVLSKIAELALKRSRLLLVLTTVAVVAMGALGVGAFGKLLGGGFDDPGAQSSRAAVRIDEKFGGETNLLFLVGQEGTGRQGPGSPAVDERGRALTDSLKADSTVSNVVSYWDTKSSRRAGARH